MRERVLCHFYIHQCSDIRGPGLRPSETRIRNNLNNTWKPLANPYIVEPRPVIKTSREKEISRGLPGEGPLFPFVEDTCCLCEVWRPALSIVLSSPSNSLCPMVLEEGWETVWVDGIILDGLSSHGSEDSVSNLTWVVTI